MRLTCDVDVCNRLLPSFNMRKPSKGTRTQLSVGTKPGSSAKDSSVYLLMCTAKDRNGNKYLIKNNVQQIFGKFLSEGKATIRFHQPQHDVVISKADPILLKNFLNVVKLGAQGKEVSCTALSTLAPASNKQVEKLKTRMSVQQRKDYPLTSSFPSSLTSLQVMNCSLKRFDSRMLQLKRLTKLDLSNNVIAHIPTDIGRLTNLSDLILANNQIVEIPARLFLGSLQSSLKLLDFSNNKLRQLPPTFCRLQSLINLKMDRNVLELLPSAFGKLITLRFLVLSKNQLKTLPASFMQLRLENLDLFDNPLVGDDSSGVTSHLQCPTLLECAGRSIRKQRLPYSPEDVTRPLFDYLNAAKWCLCGNPCFQCRAHFLSQVDLRKIAGTVAGLDIVGRTHAPVESYLCSKKCLQKYQNNPNALWK